MNSEIDLIRVRELLGHINEATHRLRQLGAVSEEEFLADYRNTESGKYLFIVATEAAIDLCIHIAARAGGRAPQNYADCFTILAELDVVDRELASRLGNLAHFRNLLVRLYADIDNFTVETKTSQTA